MELFMSYLTQSRLASDSHIMARVTACAASEGIENPQGWTYAHQWQLSAQPGWVEAYRYSIDSGDEEPGANEAAVTDGMILSAVQVIAGIEPVPVPDDPMPEPEPEPEPMPEPEPDPEPEPEPEEPEEPESEGPPADPEPEADPEPIDDGPEPVTEE